MRDPIGQHDLQLRFDRGAVCEFDTFCRQAGDVLPIVHIVKAHFGSDVKKLLDDFFACVFGDGLCRCKDSYFFRAAEPVILQPSCRREHDFNRRAFACGHRTRDAAAGIRFQSVGSAALVEARRTCGDWTASIIVLEIGAQAVAMENIGHAVTMIGKPLDTVERKPIADCDNEIIVVDRFELRSRTLERRKADAFSGHVDCTHFSVNEIDVVVRQRFDQVHALVHRGITSFENIS